MKSSTWALTPEIKYFEARPAKHDTNKGQIEAAASRARAKGFVAAVIRDEIRTF